jgi:hypothetical protein
MTRIVIVVLLSLGATVSRSPFCAHAEALQQQPPPPPMPEPGNPGHQPPTKGAWCDRSKNVAHSCKCHAQCEEDEQGNLVRVREDPKCRAYCYRSHCHCPADCE